MNATAAIARILQAEGVEYPFCFPHNEIIDAAAELGIRPILACTERVAINIADGFSYRVIWELMHTVHCKRTVVTHDAGSPRDQMLPFHETLVPHGYMGWGNRRSLARVSVS